MKKVLIIFLFIFCSAQLYSQIQIYGRKTCEANTTIEPDINIFGSKKITENFSLTYFALVEEKWSECLIGFSHSPADFICLNIGAGIEHNPAIYRLTASLWLGKGKTSFLVIGEKGDGQDNYWYKSILKYEIDKKYSVGIMSWRYHGVGPFVELETDILDSKLWINPVYDFEFKQTRLVVGVDIKI